jgi:hypothetical protein
MQSFCASSLEDTGHKANMRLKMVELVRLVKDAMGLLSNLSSNVDNYKPCAAGLSAWTSELGTIATSVVDTAVRRFNTSSWEDRQGLHEFIAKGIVAKLNGSVYKAG